MPNDFDSRFPLRVPVAHPSSADEHAANLRRMEEWAQALPIDAPLGWDLYASGQFTLTHATALYFTYNTYDNLLTPNDLYRGLMPLSSSSLVIPKFGAGIWALTFNLILFTGPLCRLIGGINVNGTCIAGGECPPSAFGGGERLSISVTVPLNEFDVVRTWGYQLNGTSSNITETPQAGSELNVKAPSLRMWRVSHFPRKYTQNVVTS